MTERLGLALKLYEKGRQDLKDGMKYYRIAFSILCGQGADVPQEYEDLRKALSRKLGKDAEGA